MVNKVPLFFEQTQLERLQVIDDMAFEGLTTVHQIL